MSDAPFTSTSPDTAPPRDDAEAARSNGARDLMRGIHPDIDAPGRQPGQLDAPLSSLTTPPTDAVPPLPRVRETGGGTTHVYGAPDVVAHSIERLILETRKRDLLEGVEQKRDRLIAQPFVRSSHGQSVWKQLVDPTTDRPRQPVIIIVAPRSCGSTTLALRLLAEHTAENVTVVKLDADWRAPSRGRLPLERKRAYQLDLKHPERDQVSADFLNSLSEHATHLRSCRSYLALTVAQDLWRDHRLSDRDGIQVVHLHEAPDAQEVVEAHLDASGYGQLATTLRALPKAGACLRGLSAVAAVRAAHAAVLAWTEHTQGGSPPSHELADSDGGSPTSLEERILAALTDWREELDTRFGETTHLHTHDNPSLTVEDRSLLLALAVQQSAPMPVVARSASALLDALGESPGTADGSSQSLSALAGRGMRRRIRDVGGRVDMQDTVAFDRPAYGRAVLEYVWDNYDVMRRPLLAWLVSTARSADPDDPAVAALAELTVRHGTADYLTSLGELVGSQRPEVLGAVMESAVRNEHVGRVAWDTLYGWAEQKSYAPTVIALCRRILEDSSVAASLAKRAMVRLRRVAHKNTDDSVVSQVRDAFDSLVEHPAVVARLVGEVQGWQRGKFSPRGGALAFLALMTIRHEGTPWLVCSPPGDLDVQRAVRDLLSSPATVAEAVSRLTDWIRSCADDPGAYTQMRAQLLPVLRGHNMFEAGMKLMNELRGISTTEGVVVADDFYNHLVDPRLRTVFPLETDHT